MAETAASPSQAPPINDPKSERLLIVGLGNPMMADDGVGHEVLHRLESCDLPDRVRLVAIDGDVLALTRLWRGESAIWLVDAVSSDRPPGTVKVYEHHQLCELPSGGLSVHHPSIGEALRWMLHAKPSMAATVFRLFGIEVGDVRLEQCLSPAVKSAVERLVDEIEGAAWEWSAQSTGCSAAARDRTVDPTSS